MPDRAASHASDALPVHALFQQRVQGDDALLRLAQLRFAQAGLAAEAYADSPEQLERIIGFVAPHARLPMVHLNRGTDVLQPRGREVVQAFASRFAGRVAGLVVHDKAEMATRVDALVDSMKELTRRLAAHPDSPYLFLEYAAGLELDRFVEIAERLKDLEHISFCIDVGHVGIRQARNSFSRQHAAPDLAALHPDDPRLPDLVADVQSAVGSALPAVVGLTHDLGRIGKRLHFHLHDGHPVIRGLPDHFSFLTQVPVPFSYEGRRSLASLYGPGGLATIVRTAIDACGIEKASFTLEIHQAEGRLPLGDAAGLFQHWRDLTNAERMNYWLSVLAQNTLLVRSVLKP